MLENSKFISGKDLAARWRMDRYTLKDTLDSHREEGLIKLPPGYAYYVTNNEFQFVLPEAHLPIADILEIEKTHPELAPPTETAKIPDKMTGPVSKDLAVALKAWRALYGTPGGLNPDRKHKGQIVRWLDAHHPDLSKGAKDRIATLLNVDNLGGAEKTSS